MKISVAMTTYNGEKYIVQQLDSLKYQTRKIDEVVICDDCSNDNTCTIIKEYINRHCLSNWKLLVNSKNLGFIENYKHCVSLTTGDIVFLADQDDVWRQEKIEVMAKTMTENQDIEVLMSQVDYIDQNGENFLPSKKEKLGTMNKSEKMLLLRKIEFMDACQGNQSPGCAICVKRDIAEEYAQTANDSRVFHDWLICALAARKGGLFMMNKVLTDYRIHSDNTIGIRREKNRTLSREITWLGYKRALLALGIGGGYMPTVKESDVLCNIRYLDSRIELYRNRELKRLLKVFRNSISSYGSMKRRAINNIKDTLIFFGYVSDDLT